MRFWGAKQLALNPGLPRPDFISQPWRKIGEYSPRFYLAVVEKNLPIFLHGCEIKSGRGFEATKQVCLSFSTPTISKVDVPKTIQIPHVFYNQSIVCIGIHPWCGASNLVIMDQSQKVKHAHPLPQQAQLSVLLKGSCSTGGPWGRHSPTTSWYVVGFGVAGYYYLPRLLCCVFTKSRFMK